MSWLLPVSDWLAHAALLSLPLFVIGSLAVLGCRQPVRRIRAIELTLAACVLAPWLGRIPGWPQWSVAWPAESQEFAAHDEASQERDQRAVQSIPLADFVPAGRHDDRPSQIAGARAVEEAGALRESVGASPPAPTTSVAPAPPETWQLTAAWPGIRLGITAGWLIGVGALAAWWLAGIMGLVRLIRKARPAPAACQTMLRDMAGPAAARVALLQSDQIEQPFAYLGLRSRAVIVLPQTLCAGAPRDAQALRWCLTHEWSHVERRDLWSWLLAGLVRTLFWYQPLAWWLRRQLRLAQDYIADARAAECAEEPADYAQFLTTSASLALRRTAAAGLGIGGGKSDLYRRVVMLVRNSSPLESRCGRLWSVSAVAVLLMGLIAVSGFRAQLAAVEKIDAPGEAQANEDEEGSGLPPRAIRELGEPRLRARSGIRSVAFSPDGRWIASCGFNSDSGIRLWEVATGKLVRTLWAPDRQWYNANVVAFSPDGAEVIAGHADGKLSVWDRQTGQRLMLVSRHDARISAIGISSHGRMLCTGGADGQVIYSLLTDPGRVSWRHRVKEREPRGAAFDGTYGVADLALTPDGNHVVAGISKSGSILVLRADTGEVVRETRQAHGEESSISGDSLSSIAVSPDGAHIISGGNRALRREDVPQEIVAYLGHINFSQVRAWSLATGERVADLLNGRYERGWGHTGLSPDGQTVAVGNHGELQLIASGTGQVLWSTRVDGWWGRQPVFSPDGNLIAAPLSNAVGLWDSRTGKRVHDRPGHADIVVAADYCPTGRLIATGGGSDLHVWDAETGQHRFQRTLGPASHVWDVQFAQGGEHLAVCGETNDAQGRPIGIVVLWSPQAEEVAVAHLPQRGEGLALSPDGNRFVVAYSGGGIGDLRLELWKLRWPAGGRRAFRDAQRVAEFPRDPGSGLSQYTTLQFSADGRYVLIAEYDGTVTRWDTSAAAEDSSFVADWRRQKPGARERDPWMGEAVFTPDGMRLVTSTKESLYVWDVATGKLEREIALPNVKHGFTALRIAADNRTLAASEVIYAGDPGSDVIRLFDITTGESRRTLEPDDDRAFSLAFSPDGTRLVTGLTRGTALVWDIREQAD